MRRLRLLALLAATVAVSAVAAPAQASIVRHDLLPLHAKAAGATICWHCTGPRVAALKYLLRNPRPAQNAFTKVKGTYDPAAGMGGWWNPALGKAVIAYKFRIGYPKAGECGQGRTLLKPIAGRYFFSLLRGWRQRPICWVTLAAKRVTVPVPGVTALALRIKAFEVAQLGVSESPLGSNRGPRISYSSSGYGPYQGATGAYGAAWCVSLQQWAFNRGGYGYFANRTAAVFYTVGWARYHGFLNARAKVGALVAFLDYQGHMGFVARVTASGFASIEGNHNNGVHEVWHAYGSRRYVFVYLPHV